MDNHLYLPFVCAPIRKLEGVPMLKNEITEKKCIWCRQPIENGRKFFCCDEHKAEWDRMIQRQTEMDENNPGIGFPGG